MNDSFHGPLFDVCINRHHGNAQSSKAFESIRDSLTDKQEAALGYIRAQGARGATSQEYADSLSVSINVVSGRFSELKRDGMIAKAGSRNRGGVFISI